MFKELNILRLFFEDSTREFNVREVARMLKITPATASTRLKELKEGKILKYRKERNLDLYKADIDSEAYRDLKVYYVIKKLRETGFIDALNEFYIKPVIVLFGSASKGLDVKSSDIDLVVISEKTEEFARQEEFEKKIGRELQLFPVIELKDLKNKHLINNVLNGIVLQGELAWT